MWHHFRMDYVALRYLKMIGNEFCACVQSSQPEYIYSVLSYELTLWKLSQTDKWRIENFCLTTLLRTVILIVIYGIHFQKLWHYYLNSLYIFKLKWKSLLLSGHLEEKVCIQSVYIEEEFHQSGISLRATALLCGSSRNL